jgi:hypothetical protein
MAPKGIITVLPRTLKNRCGVKTQLDLVRIKHPGEWQKILRSHFAGSANKFPSAINAVNNAPTSSRPRDVSTGELSASAFKYVSLNIIAVSENDIDSFFISCPFGEVVFVGCCGGYLANYKDYFGWK